MWRPLSVSDLSLDTYSYVCLIVINDRDGSCGGQLEWTRLLFTSVSYTGVGDLTSPPFLPPLDRSRQPEWRDEDIVVHGKVGVKVRGCKYGALS